MRGEEVEMAKLVGTYRVAVLGDSSTFGYGVALGDTFPVLLERKLDERLGGKAEVFNFGVAGYSTAQELSQLKSKVLQFKPDLIIIAQHLNDIYGTGITSLTPSSLKRFLAEHSRLFGCFNRGNHLISAKGLPENKIFRGPYEKIYLDESEARLDYDPLWKKFGEISKREGIPIVVAPIPILKDLNSEYQYADAHDIVAGLARRAGLYVIKMNPPEVRYEDDALSYRANSEDVDHPNTKGNAKWAEIIYNGLAEQNLLPNEK